MSLIKDVGGFLNRWAINTSGAPSELRRIASSEERALIEEGRQFEQRSAETSAAIQQNLRRGKFEGYGAGFGRWLSNPVNLWGAVALAIGVIWMVAAGKPNS